MLKSTIIPFITRNCYRKEIILVLGLKLVMLFGLWVMFFSHPVQHEMVKRFLG